MIEKSSYLCCWFSSDSLLVNVSWIIIAEGELIMLKPFNSAIMQQIPLKILSAIRTAWNCSGRAQTADHTLLQRTFWARTSCTFDDVKQNTSCPCTYTYDVQNSTSYTARLHFIHTPTWSPSSELVLHLRTSAIEYSCWRCPIMSTSTWIWYCEGDVGCNALTRAR